MNPIAGAPFDPNTDPQLKSDLAQLSAARDADKQTGWLENARQATGAAVAKVTDPVGHWLQELPKNVTIGTIDAALNMSEFLEQGVRAQVKLSPLGLASDVAKTIAGSADTQNTENFSTAADVVKHHDAQAMAAHIDSFGNDARAAVRDFRNFMAEGSSTSDEVTQTIAQYAIPFLGYSRAIGGLQGASLLGTIGRTALAETATASTVLAPHDARFADVMALGKHTEGKFADAMNTIAPDGSLLNHYIDYMTNRDGESDTEGRFKNVVDNLFLSAAASGLIKTTATVLKAGRLAAEDFGKPRPFASGQQGHIAFHGSPYDFNAFDASKIGTGEGNQSFGHGLYFAENPKTANTYDLRLSSRLNSVSPAVDTAQNALAAVNGDKVKALAYLNKEASVAKTPYYRDQALKAIEHVKNGDTERGMGRTYTVDIPDEKVGKMLLWDKPLNDQPAVVAAIGKAANPTTTGAEAYKKLAASMGSEKAASDYLAQQGVPGIKYLDQGSRNAGTGTHNIVLFDPNDAKIIKKEAGGKEVSVEKAQSASRTADAKAAEVNAPKTGVHVMQTGDKQWTLFVNGKASHVYDKASNAMEDLKALENN